MMKIVNEGKWNSPWALEVVCPEADCGAALLVEERDVCAKGYRSHNCKGYYVICPVCGKRINLSAKAISPRVKRVADGRRPSGSDPDW